VVSIVRTSIGLVRVESESDGAVVAIGFAAGERASSRPSAAADVVREQLNEYLRGERKQFDLSLKPRGTDFQQKVWRALRAIPFGQTRSYADVARAIGRPTATRAVGAACGRNPIGVVVPCHRVVGSGGALTGYYWGTEMKAKLLELEGVTPESPLFAAKQRRRSGGL
jgi:methylated-DNA-[protein]-cysteine S-methyltransferase